MFSLLSLMSVDNKWSDHTSADRRQLWRDLCHIAFVEGLAQKHSVKIVA